MRTISLRAGGRRVDGATTSADACRITGWEFPAPAQRPTLAVGSAGSQRVGSSDWDDRQITVSLENVTGNVAGDASGLAVNLVSGRDEQVVTGASPSFTWTAFTDAGTPQVADMAVEVLALVAGTATLEALRAGVVVATTSAPLEASVRRPVRLDSVAIPGTGALTLRVRFTGTTTLKARRPVLGVGLAGVYQDANTPGIVVVDAATGATSRPARGESWSRAWTAEIQEACGAAASSGAPVLLRGGDTEETLTFEVLSAQAEIVEDDDWHMGYAKAKVALTCRPLALGAETTLAGTAAVVNGVPVWSGTSVVPGDAPALARVEGTWTGDDRREGVGVITTAQPTIVPAASLTKLISSWTLAAPGGGSASSNRLTGNLVTTSVSAVASYTTPVAGEFEIDARLSITTYSTPSGVVHLLVNGRSVCRVVIATVDGSGYGFRTARFGRLRLRAGDVVSIATAAPANGTIGMSIDYLALWPTPYLRSAVISTGSPSLGPVTVGDTAIDPTLIPGALNGRSGLYGGTWTASTGTTGWNAMSGMFYTDFPGGAPGAVRTATIGSVSLPLGLRLNGVGAASKLPGSVGVESVTGGTFGMTWKTDINGGTTWNPGLVLTGGTTAKVKTPGVVNDLPLLIVMLIDSRGRWWCEIGNVGSSPVWTGTGQYPAWAGVAGWRANLTAGTTGSLQVWEASLHTIANGVSPLAWSSDGSGPAVIGDLPAFEAGYKPIVALRGGSGMDSPLAPNPASVVVKATPRYLQVPR